MSDPSLTYTDRASDVMEVEIGSERLQALLGVPPDASGLVIFAHGSGSGRFSPRNNYVARRLRDRGFATLLPDLLTVEEERDRRNVFDIALLARRLLIATAWAGTDPRTQTLPLGYFGASTGAAAALVAAAVPEAPVRAIVSRGGRPDLAAPILAEVKAPTLLIVGSLDHAVIELNRGACAHLHVENELGIVDGASHLFEEPGALDAVVEHAQRWFAAHLREPVHAA